MVELQGGNDGLNTVVPYTTGTYYDLRPNLAVQPHTVLPLNEQIGLNPSLHGFQSLYQRRNLSIIQAVGYPNQSRSHFRAQQIWHTAKPDQLGNSFWLHDYIDGDNSSEQPTNNQGNNSLAGKLQSIAQMIRSGNAQRIYQVSLPGFDTHANQSSIHNNLLKQVGDGLFAFQKELEDHGLDKDVLTVVYSEFGRRIAENEECGTDHGTAGPLFIIGSSVKGGIHGDHPDLKALNKDDLRFKIDFRNVYATILDRWLGGDSQQTLGARYDHIDFV